MVYSYQKELIIIVLTVDKLLSMKILISCNMGLQHFYFVSSILQKYFVSDEIAIIFQTHLVSKKQKKSFLQRVINHIPVIPYFYFINRRERKNKLEYHRYYKGKILSLHEIQNRLGSEKVLLTKNINSEDATSFLKKFNPDVFILQGGKIIKDNFINNLNCQTFHLHSGIVPWYRGGKSTFWNIYNNRIQDVGVTIQDIDSGIDTGKIYITDYINDIDEKDNEFTLFIKIQEKGLYWIQELIESKKLNKNIKANKVEEKGFNYTSSMITPKKILFVETNTRSTIKKYLRIKEELNKTRYPIINCLLEK